MEILTREEELESNSIAVSPSAVMDAAQPASRTSSALMAVPNVELGPAVVPIAASTLFALAASSPASKDDGIADALGVGELAASSRRSSSRSVTSLLSAAASADELAGSSAVVDSGTLLHAGISLAPVHVSTLARSASASTMFSNPSAADGSSADSSVDGTEHSSDAEPEPYVVEDADDAQASSPMVLVADAANPDPDLQPTLVEASTHATSPPSSPRTIVLETASSRASLAPAVDSSPMPHAAPAVVVVVAAADVSGDEDGSDFVDDDEVVTVDGFQDDQSDDTGSGTSIDEPASPRSNASGYGADGGDGLGWIDVLFTNAALVWEHFQVRSIAWRVLPSSCTLYCRHDVLHMFVL
jgi:hypothetical protein